MSDVGGPAPPRPFLMHTSLDPLQGSKMSSASPPSSRLSRERKPIERFTPGRPKGHRHPRIKDKSPKRQRTSGRDRLTKVSCKENSSSNARPNESALQSPTQVALPPPSNRSRKAPKQVQFAAAACSSGAFGSPANNSSSIPSGRLCDDDDSPPADAVAEAVLRRHASLRGASDPSKGAFYLIKWKNSSHEHCKWVRAQDMDERTLALVRAFDALGAARSENNTHGPSPSMASSHARVGGAPEDSDTDEAAACVERDHSAVNDEDELAETAEVWAMSLDELDERMGSPLDACAAEAVHMLPRTPHFTAIAEAMASNCMRSSELQNLSSPVQMLGHGWSEDASELPGSGHARIRAASADCVKLLQSIASLNSMKY